MGTVYVEIYEMASWEIEQLARNLRAKLNQPRLRLEDRPELQELLFLLEQHPDDVDVLEAVQRVVEEQEVIAEVNKEDAFLENYPPPGSFAEPRRGIDVPLCAMPTGDVYSVHSSSMGKNVLVVGKPGTGKTNTLKALCYSLLLSDATVIFFDRKGDAVDCETLATRDNVRVLDVKEIPLALLQRPPEQSARAFANKFTAMIASHMDLMASRRLLLKFVSRLVSGGRKPTFSDLVSQIENFRPSTKYGRESGYREALLGALEFIENSFGEAINYAESSALDEITHYKGLTCVRVDTLDDSMAVFYACLFINWAFEQRRNDRESERLIVFVMDDAVSLIRGSAYKESSEGINPISEWSLLGRSRNLGLCIGTHDFAHVSPAYRQNVETLVVCQSRGNDAVELGRYMHLTREQTQRLSTLQPGEVVVLTGLYGKAVYGRVPEVR